MTAENNDLFSVAKLWPPKITLAAENDVKCYCETSVGGRVGSAGNGRSFVFFRVQLLG